MIIKKIAVGNDEESFIEDSLSDGFNIISSDDNNKGKTIIIQSLMYALGNDPTFPSSFNYKNYYHFVEFEIDHISYSICRNNNGFVLKTPTSLMMFDNVSELKRFWNKHIFSLPEIRKKEMLRLVDPVLFMQLFFIGQDKKATYNISNSSYYNKTDFLNMLLNFCDLGTEHLSLEDVMITKKQISELKDQKSILLKQNRILKSKNIAINYLSSISDKISFEEKINQLDKINAKIAELRKERNNAATRKARWETTIKELRSLNRTMDCGVLRCMECNSTNIAFSTAKNSSYSFDVSTVEMRSEIIDSINEKIISYSEEIEKIGSSISKEQQCLKKLMSDEDITLESIVAYKSQIFNSSDAESKIKAIELRLEELKGSLESNKISENGQKEKQEDLINAIVTLMVKTFKRIDPSSNSTIDGIFTKRDEVFSGSEATVFHLARLYAIYMNTNHNFPIIVDSFRAEDLSTIKENLVLNLFKDIPNQKIFTTTLKFEELGKYDDLNFINSIDYKDHMPSKMLNNFHNLEFKRLLSTLSIQLN